MDDSVGIRVDCPDCADVRVTPGDVTLRVCMDDAQWSYWFTCPTCERRAASQTRQELALEAIAAGSAFESWRLPAEMHEHHDGPPFQLVDVFELKLELTRCDWIDTLSQGI